MLYETAQCFLPLVCVLLEQRTFVVSNGSDPKVQIKLWKECKQRANFTQGQFLYALRLCRENINKSQDGLGDMITATVAQPGGWLIYLERKQSLRSTISTLDYAQREAL